MSYPNYQPPQKQIVKRGANHGLHVVLTVLTCGFWAITGWPIAAAMGRKTVTTVQGGPVPPPWAGHPQQYAPPPQQPHGQTPPPGFGPR
ncbi:hypothetical protein BX265_7001 [Streptomyces sp. TLI_235]|nr:hypothetical protein BX265_7001 [Streptomyces sp. TLI_235]